jgi:ribosomal protein S12 methylthiotransferase accessory factor
MAVARGDQGPKTLSSAGAHLRAERAILSGLVEVLASLELMGPAFDASRGRECMADPSKVDTPMDHFHLFGIPEQARALDFLERGGRQPITEAFAQESFLAEGRDLTGKLDLLLRRLLENHPDTVLVDLTPPRLARQGLYCVRALVPDMLPMTFGHGNRRTHGCARLKRWRARQELSTDSSDELPPHPFP